MFERVRSIAGIRVAVLLTALSIFPAHAAAQTADNLNWTSSFTVEPNGVDGRLNVTVEIEPGFHIYPTKNTAPSIPTKFSFKKGFTGATIVGEFEPDADPVTAFDPNNNKVSNHFEGTVTWSSAIKFNSDAKFSALAIPVEISGQICNELGLCNQFKSKTDARLIAETRASDVFRPEFAHAAFKGTLTPKAARPGQTVTLRIQADADAGWTIPTLSEQSSTIESSAKPTIVVLNKTNDWKVRDVVVEPASAESPNKTIWAIRVTIPNVTEHKTYSLGGLVGFQSHDANNTSQPVAFSFRGEIPVGLDEVAGENALSFESGSTYEQVNEALGNRIASAKAKAGQFANYSIPTVVCLALLAGFILNFMPCVLPVIGLKIMSFVQQAGENPRRILMLNIAFAAGLMAVFMLLAFVATRPAGGGWGGLFQSDRFQIVMIGVVFAFAWSFMGVWEIPIPGMSGTGGVGKLAAKEGFIGAFLKGILTTLLATPCSGPLLVPTVIWALAQPAWLTYLTFSAMGLGMALPYLVIGAFPKLIGLLPRPGNWMVTFKHAMGFAMLGAAIFLFGSLKEKFGIPTLSMALAIGIACSVIGHTSIAAELGHKLKAWAYGLAIVALGCWIAFFVLIPAHELEWNTFSKVALREELDKGNIVFVDFTADW